jgi:hypothetical protein
VRDNNIYHRHSEVFGATDTIEGLDAVGQVVELGPGVTGFHVGQVVLTIGRGIGARKLKNLFSKNLSQPYFYLIVESLTLYKPVTDVIKSISSQE